jgi:hypothetical protein
MRKPSTRMVVYAKDVENLTGRKSRTSYEILRRIKAYFNKSAHDLVTVIEFAFYMKMDVEVVRAGMVD